MSFKAILTISVTVVALAACQQKQQPLTVTHVENTKVVNTHVGDINVQDNSRNVTRVENTIVGLVSAGGAPAKVRPTAVRTFTRSDGAQCQVRRFSQSVSGRTKGGTATLCRRGDGSWELEGKSWDTDRAAPSGTGSGGHPAGDWQAITN